MKNLITTLVILFVAVFCVFLCKKNTPEPCPRIMLFTCQYGSGHKMATQGIVERLPDYDVQVVDIYNEPLSSLDPLRSWAPAFSNEKLYNEWIKKEHNLLLNAAGQIAPKLLLSQKTKIQELLTQYVSQDKPDLIISCVPLVNAPLLAVADELQIPFLVITTDIDISAFCYGLPEDLEADRSHFRITVPYEKATWEPLFSTLAPKSAFQYGFGYPTRKAFSATPNPAILQQLRDEYEIQSDENVILIMMGGNAGHAAKTYSDMLMQMSDQDLDRIVGKDNSRDKIHVICLCGDTKIPENYAFMQSLHVHQERVRIHGCPGTSKIAEIVSLPELRVVISKPGGSTVNEMIKKQVPMIYHSNGTLLDWEKGNLEYGELRGFGKHFSPPKKWRSADADAFRELLTETFALRQTMRAIPEASIDFTSQLRQAIQDMISQEGTQ